MRSVLQASGASPLTFWASAISDLPPRELEPVVAEAGSVHRLDRGADRPTVQREASSEAVEAVGIRWRRADLDGLTVGIEQVIVEPLAAQIESGVQHVHGPSSGSSVGDKSEPATAGARFHRIQKPHDAWPSIPRRCIRFRGGSKRRERERDGALYPSGS